MARFAELRHNRARPYANCATRNHGDFLADYQPNKSWYLSSPLRRQLHKIGKTAQADTAAGTHSRAILGLYEMTRVELLRDLYLWAYERSSQEYLTIKQDLAEPDPSRLAYRDLIKQTIRAVVQQPGADALGLIEQAVAQRVEPAERANLHALLVEELRRLHEGVLARYGLRPSELALWKAAQSSSRVR